MSMWGQGKQNAEVVQGGPRAGRSRPKAHLDPNTTPVCCNQPMEPELAEARDRSGNTFYATIWRCPRCRRAIL